MPQAGKVYRYFRADADHDISGDPFQFAIDGGTTWTLAGAALYVPTGSLPPRPAAVEADPLNAPLPGLTGYWWRVFTGPGQTLPLAVGRTVVRGRATDNPEEPHFFWTVDVSRYE